MKDSPPTKTATAAKGGGPRVLPLVPLRDLVVFPSQVLPLFVGRERSVAAIEEAMAGDHELLLAAQKNAGLSDPGPDEIYEVGTLAGIVQLLRLEGGMMKVLVEGKRRMRVTAFAPTGAQHLVAAEPLREEPASPVETEALARSLRAAFESYLKLNRRIPPEILVGVQALVDPSLLADTIASNVQLKLADRQELLEAASPKRRMERLLELLQMEVEIQQVEKRIRTRVKRQVERSKKEAYLTEQMHAIQKELGDHDEQKGELQELEEQIRKKKLSTEAQEKLRKELGKLKMMAPLSAEATVVRNYVDAVLALPWGERTEESIDLATAGAILDEDHFGLERVKERILEHLAVQALAKKMKGPILCFVGPPGVGKTSLGKSIARATGRRFVRLSLGGVRDEAEIRGHRRTYIGALPGKILQGMRKAGSQNPVFLLDEVDKMSTDFRGDPASALLEVLDPEQNRAFNDHYLEVDYDLSDVMFLTTANSLHAVPLPLRDRMEIIPLPGYTDDEKLEIARRYLVPKQKELCGLSESNPTISDKALFVLMREYTREAGVRSLEREIASIFRKVARQVLGDGRAAFRVGAASLEKLLGVPRHRSKVKGDKDDIGLVQGLAVTQHGGELLATEVAVMPGRGKLSLTGKLGDSMQESAQAALSYVRSRAASFELEPHFYQRADIHVHLPEGAIPKDGPSAGITIATALVSALLHVPVRSDTAMTGEITLRGRVLPVGGLKEKILAALRGGVRRVIVPEENRRELREIPAAVLRAVEVIPVEHMDEVLRHALREGEAHRFLARPSELLDWRAEEIEPEGSPTPAPPPTH
jgi:ATP-dependent Lon protease